MKDNTDKYQKFILCMMTDGKSSYPDDAIKEYKAAPQITAKMEFKAVAYAGGSENLEKISKALGGVFVTALLANQLANAFISLVSR